MKKGFVEYLIRTGKPVRCCTIPLIINECKKKGISKKEALREIEKLMRAGKIYQTPLSICWLELNLKKQNKMTGREHTKVLQSKLKEEFLKISLTNQFPKWKRSSQGISFVIPLSDFGRVSKHPNYDIERYYLKQIIQTLKIREAEELFKLLQPALKEGSSDKFFSGGSRGIFVPGLKRDYQIPSGVKYSAEISFLEIGRVDIDTGEEKGKWFVNVRMRVGGV